MSTTTTATITPKQLDFIRVLITSKLGVELAAAGTTVEAYLADQNLASLTRQAASQLIDALKGLGAPVPTDPVEAALAAAHRTITNRRAGACKACQRLVGEGEGKAATNAGGGWDVYHLNSAACAAVADRPTQGPAGDDEVQALLAQVTPGCYAIASLTGNNDLDFFAVKVNTGFNNPAKKGQRYILRHLGGHAPQYVRRNEALRIAQALVALTAEEAADARVLFGQQIKLCGDCGRSLTDKVSRDRGIGPDCWAHRG